MDVFYNELRNCSKSVPTDVSTKCNLTSLLAVGDNQSIEKGLKCAYAYRKCDPDLEYFLSLEDVATYPQIVKGGLYDYIVSLNSRSSETCTFNFYVILAFLSIALFNFL